MSDNDPDDPDDPQDSRFGYLRQFELKQFQKDLEANRKIDDTALARALLRYGDYGPLPEAILQYLSEHLKNKGSGLPGRHGLSETEKRRFAIVIRHYYRRNLAWLQHRMKRYEVNRGRSFFTAPDYFKRSPSELAAMMVARKFYGTRGSYKTVLNMMSSHK